MKRRRQSTESPLVLHFTVKGTVCAFLAGCLKENQQEGNWRRWTLKSSVTFRVCMFNSPPSSSSLFCSAVWSQAVKWSAAALFRIGPLCTYTSCSLRADYYELILNSFILGKAKTCIIIKYEYRVLVFSLHVLNLVSFSFFILTGVCFRMVSFSVTAQLPDNQL